MTKVEQQQNREEWRKRVLEFRASGLSGAAWCVTQGIKPHLLYYWTQQLAQPDTADPVQCWQPLVVSDQQHNLPGGLSIQIGRTTIEVTPGFDAKLLSDVVRVLAAVC